MVAKAKDPTRTTLLRRKYVGQIDKRFNKLKRDIKRLVVDEDAFGLKQPEPSTYTIGPTENTRWKFDRNPDKVDKFRSWLKDSIDSGLLGAVGDATEPWTNKFVDSSYRKGATRAFVDTRKLNGLLEDDGFFQGRKAEFLNQAFSAPETVDKLQGLFTRNFAGLEGITQQMDTAITRVLTSGLASGIGAKEVARQLNKQVDISKNRARTLARTEIIHAHSEGQLDNFERLGVQELGILAEWSTAGDDRVCPLCQPLEEKTYTIKEARGLIPRHPNCRCTWIPTEADVAKRTGKVTKDKTTGLPVAKKPRKVKAKKPTTIPPTTKDLSEIQPSFKNSVVQEDLFHGTEVRFQKFDITKVGTTTDEGFLGKGLYFSTDVNIGRTRKFRMRVSVDTRKPLELKMETWGTDKRKLVRSALGLPTEASVSKVNSALSDKKYDAVILDYSKLGYKHKEIMIPDADRVKILGIEEVTPQ